MRQLLEAGLLDGDCLTVTGRTMAENLAALDPPAPDGDGRPPALDDPIHAEGGIAVLRGSLAPNGAVVKVAGIDDLRFEGTARVFDGEDGGHGRRSWPARIQPGDVVVIRYEGPKGGPGHAGDAGRHRRPEGRRAGAATSPWSPTAGSRAAPTASAWATWRPRRSTAGPSRSWPTATASSSTPAPAPSTCWSTRPPSPPARRDWKLPQPRYTTGVLAKYARLVTGAERGAITEP